MTTARPGVDNRRTIGSSISTTTSSSTTESTEPGVLCDAYDLEVIRECYEANIGSHITSAVAHKIEYFLMNGVKPDVIVYAIEETGLAMRPSPHYMIAILRRCLANGLLTRADVEREDLERYQWQRDKLHERENAWYM